jgi:hypothetical protein
MFDFGSEAALEDGSQHGGCIEICDVAHPSSRSSARS